MKEQRIEMDQEAIVAKKEKQIQQRLDAERQARLRRYRGESAAARLPDMTALRQRFAPDPASPPAVVVQLTFLAAYDILLAGEAA
jgi:hypothetical protein